MRHAGKVRAAVLLVAGDQDRNIEARHGEAFHRALTAHAVPNRFILGLGEGHSPAAWTRPNQVLLWQHLLDWLDRHLMQADVR